MTRIDLIPQGLAGADVSGGAIDTHGRNRYPRFQGMESREPRDRESREFPGSGDGSDFDASTTFGVPVPDPAETQALVRKVLQGVDRADEKLWERFVPGLRIDLRCRVRMLDATIRAKIEPDAEDILQVVFTKFCTNLSKFETRGKGSFFAWLRTILEREFINCVNYWRRERRSPYKEQPAPAPDSSTSRVIPIPADGASPHTLAGLSEDQELVALALSKLTERDRQILLLRFFGGATWVQIQEALGEGTADAIRMECTNRSLPAMAVALRQAR